MFFFYIWIICIIMGAMMLSRYNRSGTGLLLGLFLGPIGLLFALKIRGDENRKEGIKLHEEQIQAIKSLKVPEEEQDSDTMKKCHFCAELIKKEAILCRYCGREVAKVDVVESVEEPIVPTSNNKIADESYKNTVAYKAGKLFRKLTG